MNLKNSKRAFELSKVIDESFNKIRERLYPIKEGDRFYFSLYLDDVGYGFIYNDKKYVAINPAMIPYDNFDDLVKKIDYLFLTELICLKAGQKTVKSRKYTKLIPPCQAGLYFSKKGCPIQKLVDKMLNTNIGKELKEKLM